MELYDVMVAINKYVEKVIMPRFPEIKEFEVEKSKHRKAWTRYSKIKHAIDVNFYIDKMDGDWEEERLNELTDNFNDMKIYLSIPEKFSVMKSLDYL